MSLDTSKKIKSITYNGTEIPLDDTELLAVQAELEAKEAELAAQQAIEDSIIERTLTTYYNDRPIDRINQYMFLSATSLESVHFRSASLVQYGGFQGCTALKEAIFEKMAYGLNSRSFYNCSSLTVLVLSGSTVARLLNVDAFTGTPVADGTGYVYVRDDLLVDGYKEATNWSTYADQIKSLTDLKNEHPDIYAKLEL